MPRARPGRKGAAGSGGSRSGDERRPASESDLRAFAGDALAYEFGMLHLSCEALADGNLKEPRRSMVLESFLVHARAVIEFYYWDSNRDFHASDYFSSEQGHAWFLTADLQYFDNLYDSISAHLSHLSKERVKRKEVWEFRDITLRLQSLLDSFLVRLSIERQSWFSARAFHVRVPLSMVDGGCTTTTGSTTMTTFLGFGFDVRILTE